MELLFIFLLNVLFVFCTHTYVFKYFTGNSIVLDEVDIRLIRVWISEHFSYAKSILPVQHNLTAGRKGCTLIYTRYKIQKDIIKRDELT